MSFLQPIKNGNISQKKKKHLKNVDNGNDDDDEILSDDLDDIDEELPPNKKTKLNSNVDVDSESDYETAQEKKIRLAKKYLSELENQERLEHDDDDGDFNDIHRSNLISTQLKESVLEKSGQLHRKVADNYSLDSLEKVVKMKNGHRKTITCCVVSTNGEFVFTASKDCSIIKWNSLIGKRLKTIFGDHRQKDPDKFKGHTGIINALALSSDFKFLASGCVNKLIHIWNPNDLSYIHTFRGHRDSITGLSFRRSFHQLFSCSTDRIVKVWNLDEMAYNESLFGHHDSITAIDSFVRERAITCGGRDGTIRLWKIPEESHLIYLTGGDVTIDCVRFLDESHFISACDNGYGQKWRISCILIDSKKIVLLIQIFDALGYFQKETNRN